MLFALCACLLVADDLPKVEVEGFEVAVESARRLGGSVPGAGSQMRSLQMTLKIEPKDASDGRKAVLTSKVVVAPELPNVRWSVSTFPSSLVQQRGPNGNVEFINRGTSTRVIGSWRGEDKGPDKLESLEGELAVVETTSQNFSFSGGELVAGATQKQGDVNVRLFCYDLDPDDETLQIGVRFRGPHQGQIMLRAGGIDADAMAMSRLQQDAASGSFELEFDDGSRAKAVSQMRTGGSNLSQFFAQFQAKGKKPKTLHITTRSIVGEPRRVPFKIENIPITDGPAPPRAISVPAPVAP